MDDCRSGLVWLELTFVYYYLFITMLLLYVKMKSWNVLGAKSTCWASQIIFPSRPLPAGTWNLRSAHTARGLGRYRDTVARFTKSTWKKIAIKKGSQKNTDIKWKLWNGSVVSSVMSNVDYASFICTFNMLHPRFLKRNLCVCKRFHNVSMLVT